MDPLTPLPFARVQQMHRDIGGGMPLNDFANLFNEVTGTTLASSAIGNPFELGIKRASAGIDRFLDTYAGGVEESLGDAGAWLFRQFGADEAYGRQVGEETLRNFLDFVPAAAGYALAPVTGGVSVPIGLGASAALAGSNAYEKTDSELMALLSMGLAAGGGKIAEFGATTALRGAAKVPALKALGIQGGTTQVVQQGGRDIEQLLAKTVGDRVLGAASGETALNLASIVGEAGVQAIENDGQFENPFTKENILANLLDPTLVFGVKELVQPSVISQKVVEQHDSTKKFTNSEEEESVKSLSSEVPNMQDLTPFEIERIYRDYSIRAKQIEDEDQRKATQAQLDTVYKEALKTAKTLTPSGVGTLFGESLTTKLAEEQTNPILTDTVDEATGQVVKTPVTLENVLSPTELEAYNSGLKDILSPESMIRLTELSEIDTPKTAEEFKQTVVRMNTVRAELERGTVDDAWFQKKIVENEERGDQLEIATEKAWQTAKNETEALVDKAAVENADLAELERLYSLRGEAAMEVIGAEEPGSMSRLDIRSEEDFTDSDIKAVVSKLNVSEEEALRILDLEREGLTLKDAKARELKTKRNPLTRELADQIAADLIEGGIKSKGIIKLTAENHGLTIPQVTKIRQYLLKHGDRIIDGQADMILKGWADEELGLARPERKSQTESDPDIVDALEAVEDADDEGYTPTDWSKLEVIREMPNSAQGILQKLKAKRESLKKPKGGRKNPLLDVEAEDDYLSPQEQERRQRQEIARLLGETDEESELAFFPNGTKPLVAQRPAGDEALSVSLADVLGVEDKTGDVFVGNLSAKFARGSKSIDENVVAKWFSRFGLGSKTWEAYKLAYPGLVEGKKVSLAKLRELAKKPLVDVTVHGGEPAYSNSSRSAARFQHELETRFGAGSFEKLQDAFQEDVETGYSDVRGPDLTYEEFRNLRDRYYEIAAESNPQANRGTDFAEQYGFVAPDNFEPFDSSTGLGNVAYELRVPGVTGGGAHTNNDDTLAWVRGKFVEVDGQKVFRIDEVQSDAAQGFFKEQARLKERTGLTMPGHPFFDNYETMALRVAIERAKQAGADSVFLPDGETAMMSEGHDRVDVSRSRYERNYSTSEQAKQAAKELNAEYLTSSFTARGNVVEYTGDLNLTSEGFTFTQPEPRQSKGMRDAYDRRLPQTTSKLLGSSGVSTSLGTHKNGPSEVFKETVTNKSLPTDQTGNGKSSVTGRLFPLDRVGFDDRQAFESARVETREELFKRTLRKKGLMSNQAIDASMPTFNKLFDMFDADDVRLYEIVDDTVRGAATIKGAVRKLMLGGKGLENLTDKDRVRTVSFVTAHELGHLSEQLFNNGQLSQRHFDKFQKFKEWTENSTPDDRKLAMELLRDGMLPKDFRDSEVVQLALGALEDGQEVRANLMSMWAMGQTFKPDGMALNLLPGPLVKGIEVLQDLYQSVVGSMRGLGQFGDLFLGRQNARQQLDSMSKMMKDWKKELNKSEDFYAEAQGLATVGAASIDDALAFFGGKRKDKYDPTSALPYDPRGVLGKVFDEWVMPFDQLLQKVPQFRGIGADLHNYNGDVRAALNRIAGMITGEISANGRVQFHSRQQRMQWNTVKDSPKLNKLISEWMLVQQTTKNDLGGEGKKLSYGDLQQAAPALYRQLQSLPTKQREAVVNIQSRMGNAMQQMQREALNINEMSGTALLTSYLANKDETLVKDAPGLARMMSDGIVAMRSQDPAQQQAAQLMMSQVVSKLGPELFHQAYKIAENSRDGYDTLLQQFTANPQFFSEMRFGKHFLHWNNPDGTTGGLAFDNLKEARAKEAELRQRGVVPTLEETRRGVPYVLGQDRLLARLEEMDERGKALVDSLDLDDETKRTLKREYNSRWDFMRDLQATKIVEEGSKRSHAEGREDLDMLQTQMMYFQAGIRTMQKKLLNHRLNYRYADPAMKDPLVQSQIPSLEQHIENFFTPDTEVGRGISTFNAGYFLGLNLSSHMVELMQPGFSFVPEMVNQGMGLLEANKVAVKAMQDVGMFTMKHLPSKAAKGARRLFGINEPAAKDNNRFWANAEYGKLMDYAAERGAISLGHASEVLDMDIESNTDLTGLMGQRRADQPAWKKYGITPAMELSKTALKFYQQFTEFNARVSLIMGYELAKKNGASGQKALEDALRFSRLTTFSGGKLNRPEKMFSGEGNWRTTGQALYSLNGYTFGMLGAMRRYAETAYSKNQYPDLSDSDRKNARKALRAMVGAQFLGAGAMGMPFVGAALAGMNALTGIDLEKEVREGLADLFQEDEEKDGGLLSDMVMHGVANALAGTALPGAPDVGSRFAIGGVMGLNSYDGFSFSQLFGPTASVAENVVKGATSLARGDAGQALSDIAPVAAKKVIELLRNEGELRGRNGETLIDSTYGEQLAYGFGFTPQRVSKMRTRERIEARHQEKLRQQDIRRMDQLAETYLENPVEAQRELLRIAQEDPKVDIARKLGDPARYQIELEASKRRAAAKIVDRIEKKVVPRDTRPSGTLNTTYGRTQVPGASEVERLQRKAEVEYGLGLQPSLSQRAINRAALIDRLRQQNPGLGRPEAAEMADQLLAKLGSSSR